MDPSKEREILLDYQYTRDKNLALQEKRIKEINEKYPDIDSLSNDIRMMGLNISKMLFNSCSDEDIETMRYELNSMIKKKSDLFEYYGIPSDYLDLKYRCPICKDTGFLESGDQCKCLKQKILQDSY
ncbi:MAG: DNA replication protein DnaC, partial [Peptostreptococcus anaerobius]